MALNPFLGMNREQLDHTRVILQLAAALGSFEAAFEALDQCNGDEQVDIKLWELNSAALNKLADHAEMIQASGGGKEVQQALRDRAAPEQEKRRDEDDGKPREEDGDRPSA